MRHNFGKSECVREIRNKERERERETCKKKKKIFIKTRKSYKVVVFNCLTTYIIVQF